MNEQYLIDRIIKDAKTEAAKIVKDAKTNAAGNIAYAREQSESEIATAVQNAKKTQTREIEIAARIHDLNARAQLLTQKTRIVNQIFDEITTELSKGDNKKLVTTLTKKYAKTGDTVIKRGGGVIIQNSNYELRLTVDELMRHLRADIESEVIKILFNKTETPA